MSILQNDIPGARVLDLFAGSGALGLESLSRGAVSADLVENDPRTIRVLEGNIAQLGAAGEATVHRRNALAFAERLATGEFDVAFADPPYRSGFATRIVEIWQPVRFSSILSVEHAPGEPMPDGGETRRYGSTAITFYRNGE